MLVKCGMQMTPRQLEKLTDYMNGQWCNWLHKVLSLAIYILPMPPKLGWSQRKSITPLLQPFVNRGVQVTSEGRQGAAIGTEEFVISHVKDRIAKWTKELDSLAAIALSQPHVAFTHGLSSKWFYLL